MTKTNSPTVLLLDGDHPHTLQVAAELWQDLRATIIGVGSSPSSRLFRSRYVRHQAVAPSAEQPGYPGALLELINQHRPNMIVPVGFRSVAAVDAIRRQIPEGVAFCLPPSDSIQCALNKSDTLALARALGIEVPTDYTDLVRDWAGQDGDGVPPDVLRFPLFLKAAEEAGRNITARVDSPQDFWKSYRRLKDEAGGGEILVQEYVNGDSHTYGCGLLMDGEDVALTVEHDEIRSVPRLGGSSTRIRLLQEPELRVSSVKLLKALHWRGVALVEYKKRPDGGYVLMEVNPKFWASYALASKYGYRFASTMVAQTLGIESERVKRDRASSGELVFPVRELLYAYQHRATESMLESVLSILWPPARWDLNLYDLGVWLPRRKPHALLKAAVHKTNQS